MHNKFLMAVKFWTSWGVATTIFKITILRWLFSKMVSNLWFLKNLQRIFHIKLLWVKWMSDDKKVLWFSWNLYILYIMYIPITKTEEKCAGQLSYGCKILDKLGSCPNNFQNHTTTVTFFKNGVQLVIFWKISKGFTI